MVRRVILCCLCAVGALVIAGAQESVGYIDLHTHIDIYIYIYICTYTYTYMYTYRHTY